MTFRQVLEKSRRLSFSERDKGSCFEQLIQLPLRWAWAITVHEPQGQTYQSVAVDLSDGAFAHGQTYAALSRCVSLNGLCLDAPIKRDDVAVGPVIVEFMKKAVLAS